jgi:Sortilin, neurotensin receptor 3,
VTSKLLLTSTTQCNWAHSTSQIPPSTPTNLIFCVAFDQTASGNGKHTLSTSRLFSSSDFFQSERTIVDFGLSNPKASRGVVGLGVVSKFLVAAVKDLTNTDSSGSEDGSGSEMNLYVSLDGSTWSHAKFPHASSSKLFENAYTIVESTTHSLAVDVLSHSKSTVGTLFVSNSNGTYFVESLKDTNRNDNGFVDFEDIVGVEGVGIANIVSNAAKVDGRKERKKINSVITFDDGASFYPAECYATCFSFT